MSKNLNLDLKGLPAKLTGLLAKVKRYSLALFVVFVAAVYGFVLFRIQSLSNVQPSNDAVTSQVKAARIPHIDPAVVRQLESLQDNSVSVQALFDEARSNPFE